MTGPGKGIGNRGQSQSSGRLSGPLPPDTHNPSTGRCDLSARNREYQPAERRNREIAPLFSRQFTQKRRECVKAVVARLPPCRSHVEAWPGSRWRADGPDRFDLWTSRNAQPGRASAGLGIKRQSTESKVPVIDVLCTPDCL